MIKITSILLFLVAYICCMQASSSEVFNAHLSNSWYPSDQIKLRKKLGEMDKIATQKLYADVNPQSIRALVVPHAGYNYSGEIAASAYRLLKSASIKRVILLAPSHQVLFAGIALPSFLHYKTPLGQLKVDRKVVDSLEKNTLFICNQDVFEKEHSLEVQLPFLQYYSDTITNITIVPLIVGTLTQQQVRDVAVSLSSYIDATTVVIVSSDFTHYGKRFGYQPFTKNIQKHITRLDSGALQAIQEYDLQKFFDYVAETKATICGKTPLALLVALLENKSINAPESRLLAYTTSSDKTGDFSSSVSYASLVFTTQKRDALPLDHKLTQYEKDALVKMSRAVLTNLFEKKFDRELLYPVWTSALSEPYGTFVTLYKNNNLRGCIGRIISPEPLYKTVAAMTQAAAFNDSRFSPVTYDELKDIRIEVSVLTQPKKVASYHAIVLGKHGIILRDSVSNKSAVYLPKVAIEQKWDLPVTLSSLSEKVGLSKQAWKEKTIEFEIFESIDFGELKK